jgi:hypothetical protein
MRQVSEYIRHFLIFSALLATTSSFAKKKTKAKMIDKVLINKKDIKKKQEAVVVIPKNKFYVKNKIGKAITGISFARNWKDIDSKHFIENDNEIATGDDGIACLATNSDHNFLLLPFARVRAKILKEEKGSKLNLQLYSGSAIVYVPPGSTSKLQIAHSKMDSDEGYFYAINDRKINKYVLGVLTEEVEVTNKVVLKEDSLGMTTREYLTSSDLKEQKVRKISWKLQKAAKKLMDQCRKNKIDFKKMKEQAKRIYALLNVSEVDKSQQQNMEYKPVYDFPEHYRQSKVTTGFGYTGSSYSLSSETADEVDNAIALTSYVGYGRYEKIFDFANTITPMGFNIQADFAIKDSSSIKNAAGSTRNFLIGLTFGPVFEITETAYFSYLLEYDQNDFLNTNTSTANSYVITKGSVLSTTYALDKTFEMGLKQLHAQLFYRSNFSAPSFSDLYTGTSSLGLKFSYGSVFGGISYFGHYETETFTNVEDTRTDTTLTGGISYAL